MIHSRSWSNHRGIRALVFVAVSLWAMPAAAQHRPFTASASVGPPSGYIESIAGVSVNGRRLQGREAIWGGELIEVGSEAGARVEVPEAGEVHLPAGARARVALVTDPKTSRTILVASLARGAMAVRLRPRAFAYIEAGRATYAALEGASFRVALREGAATLTVSSGAVHETPAIPQIKPTISPVGITRTMTRTKTNGQEQRKFKITLPKSPHGPAAPEEMTADRCPPSEDLQGEPASGMRVQFEIAPANLGDVSPKTALTDANGIVTVNYRAGSRTGKGKLLITAGDGEASNSCEWDLQVVSPLWLWTVEHKALVSVGIAAAVAVPTVIVATRSDNRIRPIPPPVIVP